MKSCYKCGNYADYICPDCGSAVCKSHLAPRFVGPHHKELSCKNMCPVCWLVRRVVLEERMVKIERTGVEYS